MASKKTTVLRFLWFYLGMAVMMFGTAMVIKPGLGASPWDIFHLGVAATYSFPLSIVIQVTGAVIILFNMLLGVRPSVGMVLNMLSVGPMMDFWLWVLPTPTGFVERWLFLAMGLLIAGMGTAWYISAGVGSGPRDGMMIGLSQRLRLPVAVVKNGIDIAVSLLGWWLGGPLGIGTVIVALGTGPAIQASMAALEWITGRTPLAGFVKPVAARRG